MIQSIGDDLPRGICALDNQETGSSGLHQNEIEQRLKGLACRIDYHVGRGELDAAAILSSDMLSIAEGSSLTATEQHYLPRGKSFSWIYRQKRVWLMTAVFIVPLVIIMSVADFHRPMTAFLFHQYADTGHCAEAIQILKVEAALDDFFKVYDRDVQCSLADTYACDGQYELAEHLASQISEKFSDCGWAYDVLGSCEYYEGRFSDAEKHFKLSLEYESGRSWNTKVLFLAKAKFKQGKNSEANDALKLLNSSEEKSSFDLAMCARYQGDDARACQLYSEGIMRSDFRLLYQDDVYAYVRYLRDFSSALSNTGEKVEAEGISAVAAQAQLQFKLDERFLSTSRPPRFSILK